MPKVRRQFRVGEFVYLTELAPKWLTEMIDHLTRGEVIAVSRRIISVRFLLLQEPLLINDSRWLRKG